MRDDTYLEMEREAYLRRIERRRTRREIRRRREIRNRIVALVIVALIGCAVIWTTGAEGKEEANAEVHERVEMPELTVEEEEPLLTSLGLFRITHYCACKECTGKDESDAWYGITATGTEATMGRTIAIDPEVIPYGSEVAVFYDDGRICFYKAEDCGKAIKGNKIDVFVDSHAEALQLGVMGASVYLMNEEK